ncbi:sedoheptulose 7-phosphate cyclase [Polynucleobacter sp. 80A-SIGWE]|uniref:sedoheptulose 7-phosphate cyclase n=1 Tax=Polynucleobacter sp. 80A-SIGWE TaxID=2689100 RepID=UPI001C0AF1E9|nr:sedoheptulose 7-phosphate cyclase [Polynucleobacter sp. 80A-SIGWE]MBU3589067.1 sedoheptulose 7-phosphate cyclase [Polynucleobacter sp. 80A-SIGWE]
MTDSSVLGSWSIETSLPISFKIKNSPGILTPGNADLLEFGTTGPGSRRLVVIDRNICKYYLDEIQNYFACNAVDIHLVAVDASEDDKNLETLLEILREMESFGMLRRSEPLIAIGGGVLLDVAGMAAGLYRRGVPYIRVPTTLVGLIDASVGAKTGINFEIRRNRLGSYYPPIASYLDTAFLRTLPTIEISSGLGEALKMGVIKDGILFDLLEKYGSDLVGKSFTDCDCANEVINRAVDGMKVELENNLWEKDLKRAVDFGHSFSPIIEMRSLENNEFQPLTHGQAVAIDVIFSSVISMNRNLLSEFDVLRVIRTARNMNLPTDHELFKNPLLVLESLNDTKKHRNGDQNLPVPTEIGGYTFINDLALAEIKDAIGKLSELNKALDLECRQ